MANLILKRGASLQISLDLAGDDGAPIASGVVTIDSQLRDGQGGLVEDLPVVATVTAGLWTITVADTTAWPVGLLLFDLRITMGGLVIYSNTLTLQCQPAVTA